MPGLCGYPHWQPDKASESLHLSGTSNTESRSESTVLDESRLGIQYQRHMVGEPIRGDDLERRTVYGSFVFHRPTNRHRESNIRCGSHQIGSSIGHTGGCLQQHFDAGFCFGQPHNGHADGIEDTTVRCDGHGKHKHVSDMVCEPVGRDNIDFGTLHRALFDYVDPDGHGESHLRRGYNKIRTGYDHLEPDGNGIGIDRARSGLVDGLADPAVHGNGQRFGHDVSDMVPQRSGGHGFNDRGLSGAGPDQFDTNGYGEGDIRGRHNQVGADQRNAEPVNDFGRSREHESDGLANAAVHGNGDGRFQFGGDLVGEPVGGFDFDRGSLYRALQH